MQLAGHLYLQTHKHELMSNVKERKETTFRGDVRPVAGYPSTFVPQPSLALDVLS